MLIVGLSLMMLIFYPVGWQPFANIYPVISTERSDETNFDGIEIE